MEANPCLASAKYIDLRFAEAELIPEFCKVLTLSTRLKALTLSNLTPIKSVVSELKVNCEGVFRGVKELDISSNSFGRDIDSLKDVLKLFPKVKMLNISGLGLAEDVVEIIGCINSGLRGMKLSLNGITAEICNGLQFVFPRKLQELDLNENWLGMDGVCNLGRWFAQRGPQLRTLNLANNKIFRDEHQTEHLAALLALVPNLEQFRLGVNTIYDEDLAFIAKPICEMQHLTVLDMNTGGLTKDSVQFILSILVTLKNLSDLSLVSNMLADEGSARIFEHLQDSRSLRCLDLSGNKIKGGCLEKLAEYAEGPHNGRELMVKLMGNPIPAARREKLVAKLAEARAKKPYFALDVKMKGYHNHEIIKPY